MWCRSLALTVTAKAPALAAPTASTTLQHKLPHNQFLTADTDWSATATVRGSSHAFKGAGQFGSGAQSFATKDIRAIDGAQLD
jgi:hypothetical protein